MQTITSKAGLLLLVPLVAGCGRIGAQTAADAASFYAVIGVAGNCPMGTGPMRPALAATLDLNRDQYVCPVHIHSISGDTLDLMVDNDVATSYSASQPEPYIGM